MSDIAALLRKTSRTFAVTIPLLPLPTRDEVGVAYLVFRVVDTLEDGARWPAQDRVAALEQMRHVLEHDDRQRARVLTEEWLRQPPVDRAEYLELLGELPFVLSSCGQLRPTAADLVRRHAALTAAGMIGFVDRTDAHGDVRLGSVDELRRYCYVVAGIVGDMLTELFLLERPQLHPVGPYLRARARFFGEGLQLVNILKDANDDAKEGRIYLPASVPLEQVFALAREDLERAREYTNALDEAGAPRGIVGFNQLLVSLATRSLSVVEERGPGAKMSRQEVMATVADLTRRIEEGLPLGPTADAANAPAA